MNLSLNSRKLVDLGDKIDELPMDQAKEVGGGSPTPTCPAVPDCQPHSNMSVCRCDETEQY